MKYYLIILLFIPVIAANSQNADIDLLRNINLSRNQKYDNTFRFITYTATPVAFGTPLVLYGIGLIENESITKKNAIFIGVSVIAATSLTTLLKYTIKRKRPFETYTDIENLTSGGSPSFPSGHTTDAFALATSVSLTYHKWYIIVPAYLWAGAVGYSRIVLGVHYPSDVLAGAIIGIGMSFLCYKGQQLLNQKGIND